VHIVIFLELKMSKIIVLLMTLSFSLSAEAKFYKWVDDKGVTHIADTIPAEYANKDRSELDKAGRVVKTTDVLTPEERIAKAAEEEKSRVAANLAHEQKIHDSSLMNTYTSVKEIEQDKARNLQQFNVRLQVTTKQLIDATQNLRRLQAAAAATYSNVHKPLPDYVKEDIGTAQHIVDRFTEQQKNINDDKAALAARFDADMERYKLLTGKY
jgi:hypothetical protein